MLTSMHRSKWGLQSTGHYTQLGSIRRFWKTLSHICLYIYLWYIHCYIIYLSIHLSIHPSIYHFSPTCCILIHIDIYHVPMMYLCVHMQVLGAPYFSPFLGIIPAAEEWQINCRKRRMSVTLALNTPIPSHSDQHSNKTSLVLCYEAGFSACPSLASISSTVKSLARWTS